MPFSLIPKEEKFFDLFDALCVHVVEAAHTFRDLAHNWSPDSKSFEKLVDIEHEADISTHEIIDRLNRSFVTPFDREDIHALAKELDDVVDFIQGISSRMQLYKVNHGSDDLKLIADHLFHATENVRKAVSEMRNPEKTRRVLDYCIEINRLENAGDRACETAIGRLFEGKPDPLEVIRWKEIYELAEAAIDKCEDVANTLESILVKHS